MPNLVKDKICEMVKREVNSLKGTEISWPDHAIPFLGRVSAGSSIIDTRSIDNSETDILVKTQAGTRWFRVKVTETY